MTTEEKAKAYDEALERAIKHRDNDGLTLEQYETIDTIFPELKESEDEMIRKKLITFFQRFPYTNLYDASLNAKDVLAWLEKQKSVRETVERCKNSWYNEGKIAGMTEGLTNDEKYQQGWHDALENQGKQKPPVIDFKASNWYVSKVDGKIHDLTYNPADKVEPKFHVGDWVVYEENTYKIHNISLKKYYECLITDGTVHTFDFEHIDSKSHLWTIQDAKDGDVLYHSDTASNGIFIFKELLEYEFGKKVICYCDYDSEDGFCLGESHTCCWTDAKILHPATKEQRDTLEKAMADAGYTFDFENKELKEIIEDGVAYKKQIMSEMANLATTYIKQKSEPAWSDEDEKMLNFCIKHYADGNCITWLESLKTRLEGK